MAFETIVAAFDTPAHADAAVRALKASGFDDDDISIIGKEVLAGSRMAGVAETKAAEVWYRLFGRDAHQHEAVIYTQAIERGGSVVCVRVPESEVAHARAVLNIHHPVDVHARAAAAGISMLDTEKVLPLRMDVIHDEPVLGRWLWPSLAALAALMVGFYLFSQRPAVTPVAVQAPAIAPAAALTPPRLALSNENGVIHYTGVVHDEGVRASIMNALTTAFGTGNIRGGISIDPKRDGALWTAGNLRTAFNTLKIPGMQAVFDGNAFALGGVGDSDRATIFASIKGLFGSGLSLGTLDGLVARANETVVAALGSLSLGFNTQDLTALLNESIINFPSGRAEVPANASGLLQSAAAQIKQLPANTILEISGYTDNVGDPAANMRLSQQRAEAVRADLVRYGVRTSMLVAKGYGDTKPIASNDSAEGRFRNRRIEYHTVAP